MRVVCPQCDLEDEIDPSSPASESDFVCARCSADYEVMIERPAESLLPPELMESACEESPVTEDATQVECEAQNDDLLILPDHASPAQAQEDMAVLEDIFLSSPAEMQVESLPAQGEGSAPVEPANSQEQEFDALLDSQTPNEIHASKELSTAPDFIATAVASSRSANGVRIMRVSPSRLFMGGLAFVCLIVFCNLLISPIEREGNASASTTTQSNPDSNQSNNQTAAQLVARVENETVKSVEPAKPAEPVATPEPVVQQEPVSTPEPTPPPVIEQTAEARRPAPVIAEQPHATNADGRFTVQVGSYNDTAQAQERATKLQSAGFDARVVEAQIPNRGTWYRVQSGRFATRDEATRYGSELRAKGAADSAIVAEVQ